MVAPMNEAIKPGAVLGAVGDGIDGVGAAIPGAWGIGVRVVGALVGAAGDLWSAFGEKALTHATRIRAITRSKTAVDVRVDAYFLSLTAPTSDEPPR